MFAKIIDFSLICLLNVFTTAVLINALNPVSRYSRSCIHIDHILLNIETKSDINID